MKFKYQAKNRTGELQVGFVEAGSKDAAVNILVSHDLFILSMESAEKANWFSNLSGYFGRVKRKDMVIFTRQLATLLEARLPLNMALQTLYEQTSQPTLKEAVFQITGDIDAGLSFSQSLERQGAIFSEFFVNMVRTAEVAGNLDETVGFLADYIEKEDILISKARSALIYPGIVIGLFVVVVIIMLTTVFPQLSPIFKESGVKLPLFTRILIGSGELFQNWWWALSIIFMIGTIVLLDYAKSPEGKAIIDELKIRLPIIKKVFLPITMTRFANATSILLKGGVPLAQSLEIVSRTVESSVYSDLFRDVAERVRQGETLSQALGNYPTHIPLLVTQMIAVGESTGQLEKMFGRLSSFYNREADNVVNNIVDLIQPILMVGVGLLVGLLFASILIPLYDLTTSFAG
ncbi:MAG: type II secretion system F family protein [Candidatus Paceibacterota bacterium]|jgi:type II secretory pathway component PulF